MKTEHNYLHLYQAKLSPEALKKIRHQIATEVDFYRTFRHGSKSPALKGNATDGYEVETESGPVMLYPVVATETTPSIGRARTSQRLKWSVSIEVMVGGGRWHPPEADEQTIVNAADSIAKALLMAQHAVELHNLGECESGHYFCREAARERRHPVNLEEVWS